VQDCSKIPVKIAVFLSTCKNLLHLHAGGEVPEAYLFEEGAADLEDSPTCGKLGSPNDACVGVRGRPLACAFGLMPFTSSTYALNTSATLHACAMHPHGRCGGSPSKISEM
jgi:hypothetical protein